jgi:hypothetical protein
MMPFWQMKARARSIPATGIDLGRVPLGANPNQPNLERFESPPSSDRTLHPQAMDQSLAQNISPASSKITDSLRTLSAFRKPSILLINPSSCSMLST